MSKDFQNRLLKFWLTGFALEGISYCFWYLHDNGTIPLSLSSLLFFDTLSWVLWPSALMLMSLSGQHPWMTLAIVSFSLTVNGFIYMAVGSIITKIFQAIGRSAGDPGAAGPPSP
jgi:hypothetical protein